MNAKEYLGQIRKLDILIDRKNEQLLNLRDQVYSITASSDGERVKSSGNVHRLEDTIAKIMDLQSEINGDIDKLVDLKQEIMGTIDELRDPELIDLLYRRYLNYEKWERIALEMNYNIRWIYRLHGRALEKISEKLGSGR